jgi:predicted nucleic acid-binding protein
VIALDTNVLVRFLVADDLPQHEAARRSLDRLGPAEERVLQAEDGFSAPG